MFGAWLRLQKRWTGFRLPQILRSHPMIQMAGDGRPSSNALERSVTGWAVGAAGACEECAPAAPGAVLSWPAQRGRWVAHEMRIFKRCLALLGIALVSG